MILIDSRTFYLGGLVTKKFEKRRPTRRSFNMPSGALDASDDRQDDVHNQRRKSRVIQHNIIIVFFET